MVDSLNRSKRKYGLVTFYLIAMLLISSTLLPELVSGIWHAKHLSFSARYRDWDVPVPWGWFAYGDAENLVIDRVSRFVPSEDGARVFVFSYDTHSRGDLNVEMLKDVEIETMQKKGYRFTVEGSFQSDGLPATCLTFQKTSDVKLLYIECDISGEPLAVQYEGPPESIFILQKVLAGIRTKQKK
jgi:hypothetical protein